MLPPSRVYPRPHGEACASSRSMRPAAGLSPPTRGSPRKACRPVSIQRSIPAHTGKPRSRRRASPSDTVYPRPHGEALPMPTMVRGPQGLSPPTRGSRRGAHAGADARGSIPAHTGKPTMTAAPSISPSVYPRPHGEACCGDGFPSPVQGLSPPTRGSRHTAAAAHSR